MPTRPKQSIEMLISTAETAFANTIKNPALKTKAEAKGYTLADLTNGLDLVQEVRNKMQEKDDWEGAVREASKQAAAAKRLAVQAYQELAKTARAKWKRKAPELVKLGLQGKMPTVFAEFSSAASILMNNILNDTEIKTYFNKRGFTDAALHNAIAIIKAYTEANSVQTSLIGQSTGKTINQTNAINTLLTYFNEYKGVMKATLTLPEQRRLGIIARTTRTKAQKDAGKKASATKLAKNR